MSGWTPDVEWTWPDVVAIVVDYLSASVTADVRTRVPDPRPATLVRVQRAGGVRVETFDTARLQVECSAATEADAHDLAAIVRDLLRRLPRATVGVSRVAEVTGPTLLSDELDSTATYLIAVEVTVRPEPTPSPS